jgi:hypothetical protein
MDGVTSICVVSVAVSFPGALSLADDTDAVLDSDCSLAGDVTAIVIAGAIELAAMEGLVQVIDVVPEHDQPAPDAEPVMPPGRGSETLTDDAAEVELLVTTSA